MQNENVDSSQLSAPRPIFQRLYLDFALAAINAKCGKYEITKMMGLSNFLEKSYFNTHKDIHMKFWDNHVLLSWS